MTSPLHHVQVTVLYTLRRNTEARFRDLLHATDLESDTFKFHLRKLVHMRLVRRSERGYTLTASGKEFANNLDESRRIVQKQPKLSVVLIVEKDPSVYLVQQRKRNPYFGFWGFLSGPIRWGETPEVAATREFMKQLGFEADFTVAGFYRQRDFTVDGVLLEDKLFTVMYARLADAELTNTWSGGSNEWMGFDALQTQPKFFKNSEAILAISKNGGYGASDTYYEETEY